MGKKSRPIRLLLVEDNSTDALLVKSQLSQSPLSFVVNNVDSQGAAIRHLRSARADVVLLDLSLADSQGLNTFTRLHAVAPDTPIVILSGGEDEELAVRAVREGAQDYLLKGSIDGGTLTRSIRYAIERSRRDRAESELFAAGEIQRRLLPQTSCRILGYDISGRCQPANFAGGDYFDVFPMGKDRLGVVIADAAGHGIGPAITMSETRAVIRTLATVFHDVGEILTRASHILSKDLTEQTFVALFLACLNASSQTLQFAAAGHSALVLDSSGRTKRLLKTADPPLGIAKGQEYATSGEIPLEPDETLFLFTDGVIDCENQSGARFGNRRLIDAVHKRYTDGAQHMLEDVFEEVKAFAKETGPSDDMTAVIVKACYADDTVTPEADDQPVFTPAHAYNHFEVIDQEIADVLRLTDAEILNTETCTDLQEELVNYVHSVKPPKLIISLKFVTRFSSEGINVFLRLKKAVAAEQTEFKLCEMQPQIREAFKALNLDGAVFEIRNDVQDALNSF